MAKSSLKTQAARKELIERSQNAKIEIEAAQLMGGEEITINQMLVKTYEQETKCFEFKTFNQWKEEGFKVKKGSVSFRVWAKPRKAKGETQAENVNTGEPQTVENTYKFWPMCSLFNESQVEKIETSEAA